MSLPQHYDKRKARMELAQLRRTKERLHQLKSPDPKLVKMIDDAIIQRETDLKPQ